MRQYKKPGETTVSREGEQKALEDIREILNALGDDSYVTTALEGCLDIAEENIRNDALCSMKQRYESAARDLAVYNALHDQSADEIRHLQESLHEAKKDIGELAAENARLTAVINGMEKAGQEAALLCTEQDAEHETLEKMRTRADELFGYLDDIILILSRESTKTTGHDRAAILKSIKAAFNFRDLLEEYRASFENGDPVESLEGDSEEDMEY